MRAWWRSWKAYSLLAVATVSFAPYFGILAHAWISDGLVFQWPKKALNSHTCTELVGRPCLKGMIFRSPVLRPGELFLPGLTSVTPRVECLGEIGRNALQPVGIEGSNIALGSEVQRCTDGLVVYFSEKTDPASSSWILPLSVQGPENAITPITRSIQFFRIELRAIIAGYVPLQIVGLYLLMGLLGGSIAHRYFNTFIVTSLMAVVNGGVADKALFLPATFFSPGFKELLAVLLLGVFALDTFRERPGRIGLACVAALTALISITTHVFDLQTKGFWTGIIIGWGIVTVSSGFTFLSTAFFLLNTSYLLSVVTPLNPMPAYAGTLFFTVYFLGSQLEQVRLRLLNWRLSQMSRSVSSRRRVHALLKLISKVHRIEEVSISIVKDEAFEHWSFNRQRYSPIKLSGEGASSVVSKVYASGEPIIHLSKQNPLGKVLANGGARYRSDVFSSLPIRNNGYLLGVLSLTDYQGALMHQDAYHVLGDVFVECAEILARSFGQVTTRFANEFEAVFNDALQSSQGAPLNTQMKQVMIEVFRKFNVGGYFSEVSPDGRVRLIFATGTHADLIEEINSYGWTVTSTNEFGPLSLAFKDMKPVIFENWRPISSKISPKGREIYLRTGANSILTIPFQIELGNSSLRYLLWLQTGNDRQFNHDFHRVATLIQTKLSHNLSSSLNTLVSETLFSLADSQAIQNVVHGKESLILERGELLMFDLAKSTQLSAELGVEGFTQLSNAYTHEVTSMMQDLGFKLQMVIGDALILTRPESLGRLPRSTLLDSLIECERRFRNNVERLAPKVLASDDSTFRVCAIEGDISRDLLKGRGGGWAIVGSTINEVHKIEAVAKKNKSGFYFELANEPVAEGLTFMLAEGRPWPGSPAVRFVKYRAFAPSQAA